MIFMMSRANIAIKSRFKLSNQRAFFDPEVVQQEDRILRDVVWQILERRDKRTLDGERLTNFSPV